MGKLILERARRSRVTSLVVLVMTSAAWASVGAGSSAVLNTASGWNLSLPAAGRAPSEQGTLEIRGLGKLSFDPSAISSVRPDVFRQGHFSVFDILVHLADTGVIDMQYRFDEKLATHVIDSLRGISGWWYDARYSGGGFDRTVVRMDLFPVKDEMMIVLYLEDPERLDAIEAHFREEVARRDSNKGSVIIPTVVFQSAAGSVTYRHVSVTSHDVRSDVLQPGLVTALDVLLSLGEQGLLTELRLDWRRETQEVTIVDGHYIVGVVAEEFSPAATGACALMHQIQGQTILPYLTSHTHTMSHIHLTADLEVLISPATVEWLWVCL